MVPSYVWAKNDLDNGAPNVRIAEPAKNSPTSAMPTRRIFPALTCKQAELKTRHLQLYCARAAERAVGGILVLGGRVEHRIEQHIAASG
jgi:hypothetical protein